MDAAGEPLGPPEPPALTDRAGTVPRTESMNSRTILHGLASFALTLTLVGGGTIATTSDAEALARLKQRPTGQLAVPVKPGTFRVSQGFHGGHGGIDLAAPKGTPVRAVAHGRVVKVRKWRHSYGKHVVVRHPGGRTLSAHLNGIRVRKGQRVSPGQVLGRVGSTGNSTGHHLHFVLKKRGRTVNPAGYIWG